MCRALIVMLYRSGAALVCTVTAHGWQSFLSLEEELVEQMPTSKSRVMKIILAQNAERVP
jgi:hypothetical protein